MSRGRANTIFALSSGNPPAAIAVVRVSGPAAGEALRTLAGGLPAPRRASLRVLREPHTHEVLDRALLLWFPGPGSATGEDLAEIHLHGGRSVVAAVLAALESVEGLRAAEAGEFTRRAFENGRIDLAEAEGLSDLLTAETQSQRRAALALAGGALSRKVADWERCLLALSARLEAVLDFSDEGDVEEELPSDWREALAGLAAEVVALLEQPPAERLRDGVRVVIAGPPNAGKSSLFNCLVGRDAAIISALPGTTRDLVEAPTSIGGVPFLLVDTAGLRESGDVVEAIGIDRARSSMEAADLIVWLGNPADASESRSTIMVQSKADLLQEDMSGAGLRVSALTGEGMNELVSLLSAKARDLLPQEGEAAINARHRRELAACHDHLKAALATGDPLIAAEELRQARISFDRITGRSGVEDMLDALFGNFCIGK